MIQLPDWECFRCRCDVKKPDAIEFGFMGGRKDGSIGMSDDIPCSVTEDLPFVLIANHAFADHKWHGCATRESSLL